MTIRSWRLTLFLILTLAVPLASSLTAAEEDTAGAGRPVVARIVVDGPISPVSADYIQKNIEKAAEQKLDLIIIQLDTPGGLMTSTREIVKSILGSQVPVAVHVAPPGARAASAGVFITMSAHVAAMAPGTNIGAAHPVNIGGGNPFSPKKEEDKEEKGEGEEGKPEGETGREGEGEKKPAETDESVMAQKVINDTVAFAKSIAEKQGRNAEWAEKAVRESVSVTETEALELNVIDLIAEDVDDLLAAIDGRKVKISGEEVVLAVKGAEVMDRLMGFRHRILSSLSDPNIAYILMMLGIYGLFFELANPGVILPGVLGGIFLVLAFFSFQVLPINYAGFLLIMLAIVLFILEVKVVSYGMLSVGGAISLFLGSMMLFETGEPYLKVSLSLILAFTLTTALFIVVGLTLVIRSQSRKPTTGAEGMIGERGVATTDIKNAGKVRVRGEIWSASSKEPISIGDQVVVLGMDGMVLQVGVLKEEKS